MVSVWGLKILTIKKGSKVNKEAGLAIYLLRLFCRLYFQPTHLKPE